MTTYAVADQVPPGCDYITAGKEYEVAKDGGGWFEFVADDGKQVTSLWVVTIHLGWGSWRRVEK